MEGLQASANVAAIVDLCVKISSLSLQYAKDPNSPADILRLRDEATNLQRTIEKIHLLLNGPGGEKLQNSLCLDDALRNGCSYLWELEQKLRPKHMNKTIRKPGLFPLKSPVDSGQFETLVRGLRQHRQTISWTLQVEQMSGLSLEASQNVARTNLNSQQASMGVERAGLDTKLVYQETVFNRLPIASSVSFDSSHEYYNFVCLPGTQIEVLKQIQAWVSDSSGSSVFWLNGMAGMGKSTIARTMCHQISKTSQLGASFFFKIGDAERGNASRFIGTMAIQLAQAYPNVAPYIKSAILDQPDIHQSPLREQFDRLIYSTVGKIHFSSREVTPIVFVIDALDECDNDNDVKLIIDLLSSYSKSHDMKPMLKFLVTSRPELPIRTGFKVATGSFHEFTLHELPDFVINQDITTYLKHELTRVRQDFNKTASTDGRLPPTWPGQQNIRTLVESAMPLFSVAAAMCRFIEDYTCANPNVQLRRILGLVPESRPMVLDTIYLPVLASLTKNMPTRQQSEAVGQFRRIVGSIVLLANPLSKTAMAGLLGVPRGPIDNQLDLLNSVLRVPESKEKPVRLLHPSFRDFLTSPDNKDKIAFWVDEKETHKNLALNCLRVLNGHLKKNICNIAQPTARRFSVDPKVIQNYIPPELQYACLYWAHHMQQAGMVIGDNDDVSKLFREHFFHWLEALSLLGQTSESHRILQSIQLAINPQKSQSLLNFVQNALQLVQVNLSTIEAAPLQVYSLEASVVVP